MQARLQRSMLILPANVQKFVEKAHTRGADAVALDLEDSVPLPEKEAVRATVRNSISLAGKGGSEVLVRVNNDDQMLVRDLESAVFEGLSAIFLPKVESPDNVLNVDRQIGVLERERGLNPGSVKVAVHIESPLGILDLRNIANSSSRIESISLGVDDYCLSMGIRPSHSAEELFLPMTTIAMVARAMGTMPIGVFGSVAEYRDKQKFLMSAQRARNMGFCGAYCIHPDQVTILNEVFSPSPEEIDWSRRVVQCFEESLRNGRASTRLDDRMVDTPVYRQALQVMELAHAIDLIEDRKKAAIIHNGGS